MYRIRSRFYKKGDMIFISHLDLVRLFERALRRANIPISYTKGFNPHPIMSFATALGVGVVSEGEYMDLQLDEKIEVKEFSKKINEVLPEGIRIIKSGYIDRKEHSLMGIISRSVYLVKAPLEKEVELEEIEEKLKKFLELKEIIELKEGKKKGRSGKYGGREIKKRDIRKLIFDLNIFNKEEDKIIFKMVLATGSKGNLKPDVVLEKLKEHSTLPIDLENKRIYRLDLLAEKDGQYISPIDIVKSCNEVRR